MTLKNFVREGQKLPLFGVGPYIVYGMAAVTLLPILLCGVLLKAGALTGAWAAAFRAVGAALIVLGGVVWYIGALRSDMDASIAENRLKTDGIYAWVRNPMYSGWWLLIGGIGLMWANVWVLPTLPINWAIMTLALKRTEEKWLLELYGQRYADYMRRVNRCIPWPPKREKSV